MSNAPRKQLSIVQSAKLLMLVEAEYQTKNVDDNTFAKYATEKLGFSVSGSNVAGRRNALDMPATRTQNIIRKNTDAASLLSLIEGLEKRIVELERRLGSVERHPAVFTLK